MISKFIVGIPANGAIDYNVAMPHDTISWFIKRPGNALIEIIPQHSNEWVWDTVKLQPTDPGVYIDLPEVTGFSFANMSDEVVTITVYAMPMGAPV